MTIWVLIIFNLHGGKPAEIRDFRSEAQCHAAEAKINSTAGANGVCIQKA